MQFLALIESLAKVITVDNIESVATLVEKLVALAEAMESPVSTAAAPTPPVTPPTGA